MTSDAEITSFKRDINLTEFMVSRGYTLDAKASSRSSVVMVNDEHDKLVVTRGRDQNWVYFSVRDAQDCGSIIDFVQSRGAGHLGRVRQLLRPWVGEPADGQHERPRADPKRFVRDLEPVERDITAVRARWEAMEPVQGPHRYLCSERCIPASVLASARLQGRIRSDEFGNAAFVHHNEDGVCGYEIRGPEFKGFAKGGLKGLFSSSAEPNDTRAVFAESAIDALSYWALHPDPHTRIFSFSGQLGASQPALIASAIQGMPPATEIVLAMDRDKAGVALAARLGDIFTAVGRDELTLTHQRPNGPGTDWNDELRLAGPAPTRR